MAASLKRKLSEVQTSEEFGKRKRLLSFHSECESSMESLLSHSIQDPTDTEFSSDSEFEEHDYCLQKRTNTKRPRKSVVDLKWKDNKIDLVVKNRKPKCNTKNAVIARNNRLKKKKYIENLETRNAELEEENKVLKDSVNRKVEEINSLIRETINLRSVIRNRTEIGSLLQCIHLNTNLQISSSLLNDRSTCFQGNSNHSKPTAMLDVTSTNDEHPAPFNEEGNGERSEFVYSPSSHILSDIFEESIMDSGLDTSLNQACHEFKNNISFNNPAEFITETEPKSEMIDSDVLLRCETPSKGFDDFCNKENLFDDMGLCLHIANKKVSLEFCDTCNLKAAK